jgi:hypothetical protein
MSITADITLPFLETEGRFRTKYKIYRVTGDVRANSVAIFMFLGPPNRVIQWTVLYGGGGIAPFSEMTDQYGRAAARYDAGGWVGSVRIGVQYGS